MYHIIKMCHKKHHKTFWTLPLFLLIFTRHMPAVSLGLASVLPGHRADIMWKGGWGQGWRGGGGALQAYKRIFASHWWKQINELDYVCVKPIGRGQGTDESVINQCVHVMGRERGRKFNLIALPLSPLFSHNFNSLFSHNFNSLICSDAALECVEQRTVLWISCYATKRVTV